MMAYSFFSIMPMFVALFWVVTLLFGEKKNNSKCFLTFFLSLSIINYFIHWLYFNHQYSLYTFFDSFWVFTSLAGYPLFYYYIRLLTKDVKIDRRWSWIILPAVLMALFSGVLFLLMSAQEKEIFIQGVMYHKSGYSSSFPLLVRLQILRLALFKVIFITQIVLVLYFGLKLIREYNVEIRRFYSHTQKKDLSPIKWLLMFFVIASAVSLASNIVGKDYFIEHPWLLAIPSITHSFYLFGIGYVGYRQDFTIEHFQKEIDEAEKVSRKQISASKSPSTPYEHVREKLMQLIVEDKIFTNPELRITDISMLLNTNRTYVSRVINEDFQTTFSDLINTYRIDYAKKLLYDCSNDSLTLSQIAETAGFSNDSTFYRIFKEKEKISPGDFRRKHCKEANGKRL